MIFKFIANRMGFVYIMWAPSYPFYFKVGISANPKLRRAQIEKELHREVLLKAPVYILLSVPSLFRERNEANLHKLLAPFRAKVAKHSGYTEWFCSLVPNTALGCLLYILSPDGFSYSKMALFSMLAFAPFPIGAIAALLLVSLLELLFIALALVFVAFIVLAIINQFI